MPAQKVIRDASPYGVELDALANDIAVVEALRACRWQHLGRDHLQLQRHDEPVLGPALAEAEEHLAGDKHLAGSATLQSV